MTQRMWIAGGLVLAGTLALSAALALANTPPPLPDQPAPPPLPSQNQLPALPSQPEPGQIAGPAALGPLAKWVHVGSSPPWTGTDENGAYVMSNTQDATAVRYYADPLPAGAAKVKVTAMIAIAPQAGDNAGAGLIYSFDGQTRNYVAVAIQADNTVAVYKRDENGFSETIRSSSEGLLKDGANEVTILGEANTIEVLVNGQSMSTLSSDLISTSKGAGILALGRGTFTFSSYSAEQVQ